MASRIEGKRETSPISSAQVSAVIGPTPGTVLRRLIRSASKGSRCRELTRAYPFSAVARCCLGSPAAEVGYSHSPRRCLRVAHGNTPLCAAAACCGSLRLTGDPILHLHHLAHQQVSVAQGSASVSNRGGCMWHSGRKSQRRQSAILPASMRSFFFLAAAMARSISGCATFTC